jgi:hypothetical protein
MTQPWRVASLLPPSLFGGGHTSPRTGAAATAIARRMVGRSQGQSIIMFAAPVRCHRLVGLRADEPHRRWRGGLTGERVRPSSSQRPALGIIGATVEPEIEHHAVMLRATCTRTIGRAFAVTRPPDASFRKSRPGRAGYSNKLITSWREATVSLF